MNLRTNLALVASLIICANFLLANNLSEFNTTDKNYIEFVCSNFTNPGSISYSGQTSSATAFNPPTINNGGSPWGGSGGVEQSQWQKKEGSGAWTDISGATSNWYNPPTVSVSTCFRRQTKRDCASAWLSSNEVCITISSVPPCVNYTNAGTLSYSGLTTISGSYNPPLISSVNSPSGGSGGQLQYQWQSKTGTGAWVTTGITTASYNPPAISESTSYRRRARRNCQTSWRYTAVVAIEFNNGNGCPNFTNPGSLTYTGQTSASGSYNPPTINNGGDPWGGMQNTDTVFDWEKKEGNSSWTSINRNRNWYNPPSISVTTCYRRAARRDCNTEWIYTSEICVTISNVACDNFTNGGSLSYNGPLENSENTHDPSVITESTVPNGGTGGVAQYRWRSRPDGGTWAVVPDSDNPSYDPPAISENTLYRRQVRRDCQASWIWSTNSIYIEVGVLPCENYTSGGSLNYNGSLNVTASSYNPPNISAGNAPSGGSGGVAEYRWRSLEDGGSWAVIPNSNSASYNPPTITTNTRFRRQVKRDCQNSWKWSTNSIYILVGAIPCENYTSGGSLNYNGSLEVAATSYDPPIISAGTAPAGGTGGAAEYRWRSREDGGTWAVVPNSNSASYNPPALTTNTLFRRQVKRDCQNAWIWSTNSIYIKILPPTNDLQLGISYAQYDSGIYSSDLGNEGVTTIAQTGAKWMTIVVTQYQYDVNSTSIYPTSETPTNNDLITIIANAKAQGMKVTLKPHVDLQSNTSLWRGNIGESFNGAQWNTWFASYKTFINSYASLAAANGVDHFVVGTELVNTSSQETKWREVIAEVRNNFSGLLSYTANHSGDETSINWWDALDLIGVSGYYNLTTSNNPSVTALKTAWQAHRNILANLHAQWNKPIIFNEIGYRSSDGANKQPWCFSCAGAIDLQEQVDTYNAFFEVFIDEPWLAGAYFWGWNTRNDRSGNCNDGYSAYNKPAENVLRQYFGGSQKTIPTSCDTTCDNYTYAGSIQYPGALNVSGSHDPVGIGNESYPKGGTGGKLEYRWRSQVDGGPWLVIPNSNSSYYDPPAITESTCYRRQARRSCQSSWLNSNIICINVTPSEDKQFGISYARYYSGSYQSADADLAVEELAATGAEWVNFVVTQFQFDLNSTNIYPTVSTPTDDDLVHIINKAKSLGLKVSLKPHVDLQSDNSLWRGNIGTSFNEFQWNAWFNTYNDFIGHYADLAHANGVDQMIIGTELRKTVVREAEWRGVISNIKSRYNGKLTYSANHGGEETSIQWWDAVDYIGISSYYNLTTLTDPTVAQLKAGWQTHLTTLENLSQTFNKPILLTEIGYRSSDGNNTHPWCHPLHSACANEGLDLQEQADTYQAMFEVFMPKPWFAGVLAWGWDARASDSGPCDTGYSVYDKPAENIIRQYFGGSQKSINTNCTNNGQREASNENALTITSFPNPSTGQFTVDLGGVSKEATVEVYDMIGGIVTSQVEKEVSTMEVDVRSFTMNSFILVVKTKEGYTTKKLMYKF